MTDDDIDPRDMDFCGPVLLADAAKAVFSRLHDGEFVTCPCCEQTAKVYRRVFNRELAGCLHRLYLVAQGGFGAVHCTQFKDPNGSGNYGKLKFWGFIEGSCNPDPRSEGTAGWWRITQAGLDAVRGEAFIADAVLVYNDEFIGLPAKAGSVKIGEVLPNFDLDAECNIFGEGDNGQD